MQPRIAQLGVVLPQDQRALEAPRSQESGKVTLDGPIIGCAELRWFTS